MQSMQLVSNFPDLHKPLLVQNDVNSFSSCFIEMDHDMPISKLDGFDVVQGPTAAFAGRKRSSPR